MPDTVLRLGVLFTVWMWRAYRNKPAWKALNDERIEENRRRGWTAGFWAMYLMQGVWLLTLILRPDVATPLVMVITNILVGFAVSLIVFFRSEELTTGADAAEG